MRYEKSSDYRYQHSLRLATGYRHGELWSRQRSLDLRPGISENNRRTSEGHDFYLPVATIIETGNHIAHANGDRFSMAERLADKIIDATNATSPWAAFTEQNDLWNEEGLASLAVRWKTTAPAGQSLGDASIVDVANYYAKMGFDVEILTGDAGLKAYQPQPKSGVRIPRRRK